MFAASRAKVTEPVHHLRTQFSINTGHSRPKIRGKNKSVAQNISSKRGNAMAGPISIMASGIVRLERQEMS
jgi:hypothetical protein